MRSDGQEQHDSLLCVEQGAVGLPVTIVRRLGGRGSWVGRVSDTATAVATRYARHHGSVVAGGLAFFTALAIAPLVIAFGALAGLFIDPAQLEQAMSSLVAQVPSASVLEPFVQQISALAQGTSRAGFTFAGAIGILIAVFGASRIVMATRQILDVSFEHPEPHRGIAVRIMSVLVMLVAIIVGLALIVLVTIVPVVLNALDVDATVRTLVAGPLAWMAVLLLVYVILSITYHVGPVDHGRARLWSPGAAVVTLWMALMTWGLNLYVSYSATWDVAVAMLGGAAVLLLWLYLGAVGIVLGAEWQGLCTKPRRIRAGAS